MKNFRNVFINSSIIFVCATILQITMHEFGHFLAAFLVHAKSIVLHHNYESNQTADLSIVKTIIISAAGPLVSLLIGICFHAICSSQKTRGMLFLFNIYMAVFGYIAFFGYLMIAPFFTYGDTGYIFQALKFPIWLTIGIAISGAIVLFFIMGNLIRFFAEVGTVEINSNWVARRDFMNALVHLPIYAGVVITALLNLPVPTPLSLIYPICSPFCIMWAYSKGISKTYPTDKMSKDISAINKIQIIWIVVLLLIVVMNRMLVYGIKVN